jgi:hypothetical protein
MSKLFTKGERRYTEAADSEILSAAAKVLSNLGLGEKAIWLSGVADAEEASERRSELTQVNVLKNSKENMLPYSESIKLPRRGVEPA